MEAMANKHLGGVAPYAGSAPDRDTPSDGGVRPLLVELLGGFKVRRIGVEQPVIWQRRSARTLTKLLATHPRHSLHREEILETLWPGVGTESALNRFGQALHAARRAFDPELQPRESSAYLRLTDSMLALDSDNVMIDADRFQQLAETALGNGHGGEDGREVESAQKRRQRKRRNLRQNGVICQEIYPKRALTQRTRACIGCADRKRESLNAGRLGAECSPGEFSRLFSPTGREEDERGGADRHLGEPTCERSAT